MPLVLGLVVVAGCAKPPQAEIDAAKKAVADARAEASEYASQAMSQAEDAVSQLDAELKAQEDKFALFRSYKKATELAATAKAAGERAASEAATAKEQAKNDATDAIGRARTTLSEVQALMAQAPTGKGTQADIEVLKSDLAGVETSINEADSSFQAGKYKDAKAKADAAVASAENVRSAINAAIEAKKTARGKH
ncbi:MAG TPA: hypothetical protein VJS92_02500 [Candidatus Polarisedimenticolaceae bacterium]|nr:hypothetical protein [Candidatus Polarisedimenticolaceae bacterium]